MRTVHGWGDSDLVLPSKPLSRLVVDRTHEAFLVFNMLLAKIHFRSLHKCDLNNDISR